MYVLLKQEVTVSATPQRYSLFICCSIPEPKACLIFELSKSKIYPEHMYI